MFLGLDMWFSKLIRHFFFSIDRVVFGFIPTIYDLLISIARTSILSQADIISMADRIYDLLAIFMSFKVIFSLIMYVVNPDDFSDKSKGVGKLTTNIIISLGLLILTPYIFRLAYQTQTIILEDNTLANLVFGKKDKKKFLNSAGDEIAYVMMVPFFSPNVSINELQECINLTEPDTGKIEKECFGLKSGTYSEIDSDSSSLYALTKDNDNFSLQDLQNYAAGIEHQNLPLMFRVGIAKAADKNNESFIIDYRYIFSTALGIVVLLILVTFCMDVALRSVKLAFLQLIAPIPILSYVDPKSGKDGLFKKWYQMCFKTFLSLFLRLLALYFGVYIISLVDNMVDIIDGSYVTNMWIKIFVIIGTLMFVKQLPTILEGLGIKLDGDGKFFLNPFKKMEDQVLGGKGITGAAAGLAAGTVGALSGAGVLRGFSGAFAGAKGNKGFAETWKNTKDANKKYRTANLVDRNPFRRTFGRIGSGLSESIGLGGASYGIERREAEVNREIDGYKADKERIEARIAPTRTQIGARRETMDAIAAVQERATKKLKEGKGTMGATYQDMLQKAMGLEGSSAASGSISVADASGHMQTYNWSNEQERGALVERIRQNAETYANTTGRDAYIDEAIADSTFDGKFTSLYSTYSSKAATSGSTVAGTAAALDTQNTTLFDQNTTDQNSISADENAIKGYDDQIKDASDRLRDISDQKKRVESYRVSK